MVEKYLRVPEDRTVLMQSPPPMSLEKPSEPEDAPYAGNPIEWSVKEGTMLREKEAGRKCPVIVIKNVEPM